MPVTTIEVPSRISTPTLVNVITPAAGDGPFPVLYLLHGVGDDHTTWCDHTDIVSYLADLGLIVVTPDCEWSWFLNDPQPGGEQWESYVVEDLVAFMDANYNTIASRGGRALAGLSMGGYGALQLAMKHPDVFSMASSHSAALYFGNHPRVATPGRDVSAVNQLAKDLNASETGDVWKLAERYLANLAAEFPLAVRIDCGIDDHQGPDNRDLHAHLDAIGFPHTYGEFPGAHTWRYWDENISRTLQFVIDNSTGL